MVSMVDHMVDQNATYLTRRRGAHSDFRIARVCWGQAVYRRELFEQCRCVSRLVKF